MSPVESDLRAFIADNFMFGGDASALAPTRSLIEEGLIDSTGVLELVSFLEEKFRIEIGDGEIVPANLDSIAAIVAFVESKNALVAA
jgi:acyl carrier protein